MEQVTSTETVDLVTGTVTPVERVIDWEAVEVDFRAGLKTLRQIGQDHKVSHVAVTRKAQKLRWTRSLSRKIHEKADELVNKLTAREIAESSVIAANGGLVATIRLTHRKDIGRAKALTLRLLDELEAQTFQGDAFKALGEYLKAPDERGLDKLNEIYNKVISLPSRTKTMKELAETLKSLISMEREAYGIADANDPAAKAGNAITELLGQMKRSALPVVYDVDQDASL